VATQETQLVHVVVLLKPVPDPAAGDQRLDDQFRLDRGAVPSVINGNDEYALEAALRLTESHGGDVTLLAMTPTPTDDAIRRGLAMGAARAISISDEALRGSCTLSTARVLAAALRNLTYDLVLAGVDTSDGGSGVVPSGVAVLVGIPYVSQATHLAVDPAARRLRVERISVGGSERVETGLPTLVSCTQALGAPRYPALRGIMAARSKPIATRTFADVAVDAAEAGGAAATTRVVGVEAPPDREPPRLVQGAAADAARHLVVFLRERRLVP
jgi:electron transfer flavoprotein beta subunit